MSWIGVDLDGTLAYFGAWTGDIGEPIPAMVEKVKAIIREGKHEVRIMTARVGVQDKAYSPESQSFANQEFADDQRTGIEAWCLKHIGQKLTVTATKDFEMIELWDDRARQVVMNEGLFLEETSSALELKDLRERFIELLNRAWNILYPSKTDWEYPDQVVNHLELAFQKFCDNCPSIDGG